MRIPKLRLFSRTVAILLSCSWFCRALYAVSPNITHHKKNLVISCLVLDLFWAHHEVCLNRYLHSWTQISWQFGDLSIVSSSLWFFFGSNPRQKVPNNPSFGYIPRYPISLLYPYIYIYTYTYTYTYTCTYLYNYIYTHI